MAWSARDAGGLFRLAIDRAFTLAGHGTVVTGTVYGGRVLAGDDAARVVLMPSGRPVRVRTVHAQNRPSPEGRAGQRCALNLAGIAKDAISRGDWIADAGTFVPTRNIDVELRLLEDAGAAVGNWAPLHVHLGTARRLAHAVPLGTAPRPGTRGGCSWCSTNPCAAPGDRFTRDANATHTVGGGCV